jgi:predicted permease
MSLGSRVKTWWKAVTRPRDLAAQVEEELEFHIQSYAQDLMREGTPHDEAMRRARAELGSIAAVRENARAAWGTHFVDQLRGDLRYGLRMLAKSPGFTAIAVGSLALGIGANTVIFTAAQHMLLDKLSVPHPDELRLLSWIEGKNGVVDEMWGEFDSEPDGGERGTSFSYPVYELMRKQNHALEDIFAFKPLNRQIVTVQGRADAVDAEMISGNYYASLGVRPQLGRGIVDADDGAVDSGPVVVISDRFWSSHFGRSPDVIGRTLLLNTVPLTIVGVNPPGFTGAYSAQQTPDVFFPFSMQPKVAPQDFGLRNETLLNNKTLWWVLVMGRAKAGVSDATATAALNVSLNSAVRATMPIKKDAQFPRLYELDGSRGQNPSAEGLSKPIYVLMGLAGLVLLLACANLANLLLARAGARQREMSVRLALGAGRKRIVRQMLTESLMISLLGGLAGLALAYAVRNAIPRMFSNAWTPPAFSAQFDWRIFGFAAGLSLLTGIFFGFAPAWESTRVEVSSGLKDSAQTATHRKKGIAGKAIVVAQVALSTVLVVGAGLFVQTLVQLAHVNLGFRSDGLLLFTLDPPQARYPGPATTPLFQQIEQKLASIPGVSSATLMQEALMSGSVSMHTVVPEGQQRKEGEDQSALFNNVGQNFFSMLNIPIIAGRGFDATDTRTSRKVAVVNQSFIKKFFPNRNPVGLTFSSGYHDPESVTIVGVCADAKYHTVRGKPEPTFYAPYWQDTNGLGRATFALSTPMSTANIAPLLRRAVQSIDGNLPLLDVRTQNEQIAATMRQERIFAGLTAVFGVLALVLASIGIYGILAYSVSRRTNEIGIRMALGARGAQVMRMVLSEAGWMTAIGIVAGLGGALAMGRVIASLLYGLKPWDPTTLAGAAGVLLLVAVAASWVPARRAAGIDPMKALRHD